MFRPNTSRFQAAALSQGLVPFEMDKVSKNRDVTLDPSITGAEDQVTIDAHYWLPKAAEVYEISPHIRDYIMVPLPAMISDLPNTNGDSVTRKELTSFNPDYGDLAFKTFRAKPIHSEHANKVLKDAKGVILDVVLRPVRGFGDNKYVKMIELVGLDRSKDTSLCNAVLARQINTYSIGMYYDSYTCSLCGHTVTRDANSQPCPHTEIGRPTYRNADGYIVYRHCNNIVGFETSVVRDPAYAIAISDIILT